MDVIQYYHMSSPEYFIKYFYFKDTPETETSAKNDYDFIEKYIISIMVAQSFAFARREADWALCSWYFLNDEKKAEAEISWNPQDPGFALVVDPAEYGPLLFASILENTSLEETH